MSELPTATALGAWAAGFEPGDADRELARVALVDTCAVAAAGREHPFAVLAERLGPGGRLALLAHLLDYDDLHLPSTSHISAVCVPAAAATGGDARAYLAGAGVMARLGTMLGWSHYGAGWHATCTAGAPAAAVAAGVALGLDADALAVAIALAVPAAGGVQGAFGTAAKPLQVGFAVDAGIRAAELAAAGASADARVLDQWLALVGAATDRPASRAMAWREGRSDGVAVPGGLAIKVFPCCYALQRPIAAVREAIAGTRPAPEDVARIAVRLPADALQPLIHARPRTGLEGKFSLQYGLAAAVLDEWPGLDSFGDAAVARPAAQALAEGVVAETSAGGGGLLAGTCEVELQLRDGERVQATLEVPPGAPGRDLPEADLRRKVADCAGPGADTIAALTWESLPGELSSFLGGRPAGSVGG